MHLLLCANIPERSFKKFKLKIPLSCFQVINSSWLQQRLQTVQDSWRLCWGTRYEALRTRWTETETFLQTLVAPAASGITAGNCSLMVSDNETTANMYKVNKLFLTRLLRVSLTLLWWIILSKNEQLRHCCVCEGCCLVTSPHPPSNCSSVCFRCEVLGDGRFPLNDQRLKLRAGGAGLTQHAHPMKGANQRAGRRCTRILNCVQTDWTESR